MKKERRLSKIETLTLAKNYINALTDVIVVMRGGENNSNSSGNPIELPPNNSFMNDLNALNNQLENDENNNHSHTEINISTISQRVDDSSVSGNLELESSFYDVADTLDFSPKF